jgi:hypothetical protein
LLNDITELAVPAPNIGTAISPKMAEGFTDHDGHKHVHCAPITVAGKKIKGPFTLTAAPVVY